jgi:hypothetical protein
MFVIGRIIDRGSRAFPASDEVSEMVISATHDSCGEAACLNSANRYLMPQAELEKA